MALQCHNLVSESKDHNFLTSYDLVRKLGLESSIGDLQVRLSLLDFSLTHCPPENITDILEERRALEVQVCVYACVCVKSIIVLSAC